MVHIKRIDEMRSAYTADDFDRGNGIVDRGCIEYVIANVEDFDRRYRKALDTIGRMRSGLRYADDGLYEEIVECVNEYLDDNDRKFPEDDVWEAIDDVFDI